MIERKRPWEPIDDEWNLIVTHFQEAIGKSINIGADLVRIRAIMGILAENGMDWDAAWVPEGPDKIPAGNPRLRIISPPGTQQRLPLDVDHEPERKPQVSWSTAGSTAARFGRDMSGRKDSVSNARA
jgi:hypothetical protein